MNSKALVVVTVGLLWSGLASSGVLAREANWPQFRGPGARGISTSTNLPEQWSATENVAWKAEIPGRGWSSPIVWGDRVFRDDGGELRRFRGAEEGALYRGRTAERAAPGARMEGGLPRSVLRQGAVGARRASGTAGRAESPQEQLCLGNAGDRWRAGLCLRRQCGGVSASTLRAARSGPSRWSRTRRATGGGRRLRRCCTGTGCTWSATTRSSLTCWRWTSARAKKSGAWTATRRATGPRLMCGRTNSAAKS